MKSILTILTVIGLACVCAFAIESLPAKWNHALGSTYLTDYKKGEHLIISDISTGMPPKSSVRYSCTVKVLSWDKEFTTTQESTDTATKETFSVTLHTTDDPKEMIAVFNHAVFKNGKLFLRFSGQTILARLN